MHVYFLAALSYQSLFSLLLTFENCKTSIICASRSNTGSCSVGFALTDDSARENMVVQRVNESLNSQFDELLESSKEFYVFADVTIDNITFKLRRNFITGKCK